jgi:hypothetical protein
MQLRYSDYQIAIKNQSFTADHKRATSFVSMPSFHCVDIDNTMWSVVSIFSSNGKAVKQFWNKHE